MKKATILIIRDNVEGAYDAGSINEPWKNAVISLCNELLILK